TGPRDQAVRHRVGDHPGQQGNTANGVVIPRDRVIDLVRITVGVEDRHHRDTQLARLADRDVLLLGVDHPHRARHPRHVPDPAERAVELVALAPQVQQLTLGHAGAGHVAEVDLLELLEPLEALKHGGEVGQHAAQPALVDVRHPDPPRLLGDDFLGLLLGADVQDRAAVGDGLLDELVRAVDVVEGLLEVDDVDAVALGEDVALHLRVPAAGLVPEVNAALQELLHGDDRSHAGGPFVPAPRRKGADATRFASWRPYAPAAGLVRPTDRAVRTTGTSQLRMAGGRANFWPPGENADAFA